MADYDSLLQNVTNLANQNNAWSAEQVQKQMDFQREMSNTAHQREMADLKASGLNPVLSAKLGGASTPSGAAASADPSVITGFVSLMNKMLEIESDNAKANLVRVSSGSGSSGNVMISPEPIWIDEDGVSGITYDENNIPRDDKKFNITAEDAGEVASALHVPAAKAVGTIVSSFVRGLEGLAPEKDKNNNNAAYQIGAAINKGVDTSKSGSIAQTQAGILKDINEGKKDTSTIYYGNKPVVNLGNVVNSAKSAVKKVTSTIAKAINNSKYKF